MLVFTQIAEAGFIYLPISNSKDHTLCPYCEVSLEGWEEDDNAVYEHKKRNPECAYFKIQTEKLKVVSIKKEKPVQTAPSSKRPASRMESNVRKKGKAEVVPKVDEEEVVEEGKTIPVLKKGRRIVSAKTKEAIEFLDEFGADQWPNEQSEEEFSMRKGKKPVTKRAVQSKSRSRVTKSQPSPKNEVTFQADNPEPRSAPSVNVVPYSDSEDTESAPKVTKSASKPKPSKGTKKSKNTANAKETKKKPMKKAKVPEAGHSDGETVTDEDATPEIMDAEKKEQVQSSVLAEKVTAPAPELEVEKSERPRARKRIVTRKAIERSEHEEKHETIHLEQRLSAALIEVPNLNERNEKERESSKESKQKESEVSMDIESETSEDMTIPEAITPNEVSAPSTPEKSEIPNSLFDKLLLNSTISTKSLMSLYEANKKMTVKAFLELMAATALERLDTALTYEIEQLSQQIK
jgi:hypothetical protein